jgi:putative membrane-bound dehydrogenase-like protein
MTRALWLLALVSLAGGDEGVAPADASGRPLNLDFEAGTLRDWTAEGEAFDRQPIRGDTVSARRSDMRSGHVGEYWVGTYEIAGDAPQGTLTSEPFPITHPFASFLVGGGSHETTAVELLLADENRVLARVSGEDREDMRPVVVDLTPHVGKRLRIRLVDRHSGGWGHINFDHFRFHARRPDLPGARAAEGPPRRDEFRFAGLSAAEAARAMTLPPGFSATVFAAEPEIRQPIAMALDDRGRLWVAENPEYPRWGPPEKGGSCRVLVLEDADGDGAHDRRTVFLENVNFISGLEVGFGGVWIGAPPYLLFVPDRDGDDRPDGPPEVLLDGWGHQDTHETLNAFIWGPDGWLYGCHGVFTHSNVGRPGAPPEERRPLNAGFWRYHPVRRTFEVFAEGTSNPWGIDFDEYGEAFATACVIPHLWHVIPGARYHRQAGRHFNPHTYDDLKTIADHLHYVGARGPHAGNGISDAAGGGHAHCGAMIYLGDNWPEEYRGRIFFSNIHGARVNMDILEPRGSGFAGRHGPDFLRANDRWSQILNLRYGPDGTVYVIDWYDKQQCHTANAEDHDATNGRIFRVAYGRPAAVKADLRALPDEELVALQLHRNEWYVRHARRLLQERRAVGVEARLDALAWGQPDPVRTLRALWCLHALGRFTEERARRALGHAHPRVRAWAVRLACEEGKVFPGLRELLRELARTDPSPVVRLALASAAQRLPADERRAILEGLLGRAEDASDANLPLMIWYAVEPLVAADSVAAAALAARTKIPRVREFIARRLAAGK